MSERERMRQRERERNGKKKKKGPESHNSLEVTPPQT
jgi:hypothetical protein